MKHFKLSIEESIAHLSFDYAKKLVNILDEESLKELESILDDLSSKPLRALIISSAKQGIFVAGADISEIANVAFVEDAKAKSLFGQKVFDSLSNLTYPSFALIDGICLGGGLELALACSYRITTSNSKTQLGFPEVNLGILPGFGGTQRLPKLVGLIESIKMLTTGKSINGTNALKIGLSDTNVPHSIAYRKTIEFINVLPTYTREDKRNLKSKFLEFSILKKLTFKKALETIEKKTLGHYPSPIKIIKLLEETYSKGIQDYELEAQYFAELAITPTCKNLIQIFFSNEKLKKAYTKQIFKPKYVSVVGSGIMGSEIAFTVLKKDINTHLFDIKWSFLQKASAHIKKIFKKIKTLGLINSHEVDLKLNRLKLSTKNDFHATEFVLEAIVEDLHIKKDFFKQTERLSSRQAILASNSSSIKMSDISTCLKHSGRFIGMHFFNPVSRMPLVEIIPHEKTTKKTIEKTVAFARTLGKTPIVVGDCAGFLVNRILMPYLNESCYLLKETGDLEEIDRQLIEFGMPMGAFLLSDTIGNDIAYKVGKILENHYGKRMVLCPILKRLVDLGYLGKKTGEGFYSYKNGAPLGINKKLLEELKLPIVDKNDPVEKQDFVKTPLLAMVNESLLCLEEGIIKEVEFLDMAILMGIGFPAFRVGPIRYAETLGKEVLEKNLKNLKATNPRFSTIAENFLTQSFYQNP